MDIYEHHIIGFAIEKKRVMDDDGNAVWVVSINTKDKDGHDFKVTYFTEKNLTPSHIKGFDDIRVTEHNEYELLGALEDKLWEM